MQNLLINRRKSRQIKVGSVLIGGEAPISVQSMTNTLTSNIDSTVAQIKSMEKAGVDLVRVSCPDRDSTLALKEIINQVFVPIIADIHFHYKRALEAADNGAACLRINPGNIGSHDRIKEVVAAASANHIPIRIGINAGSLEKNILKRYKVPCVDAIIESALFHIRILENLQFNNFKVSVKASHVPLAVQAYEKLSSMCDYPLHVGITEAGGLRSGTVKSALGIGMLLYNGIGDTIRVSLSTDPIEEINVGFDILRALNLRDRGLNIISCPSCARQQFDVVNVTKRIEELTSHITKPLKISIMGCVVNGPGEAKNADIGFTGGGRNTHQVYIDGRPVARCKEGQDIVNYLVDLIEKKSQETQSDQI